MILGLVCLWLCYNFYHISRFAAHSLFGFSQTLQFSTLVCVHLYFAPLRYLFRFLLPLNEINIHCAIEALVWEVWSSAAQGGADIRDTLTPHPRNSMRKNSSEISTFYICLRGYLNANEYGGMAEGVFVVQN